MSKNWYIVHTYTGYEGKIERTIRQMLEAGELDSAVVSDVKVPVEVPESQDHVVFSDPFGSLDKSTANDLA